MGLMLLFLICVFVGASLGLWFVQQRVRQGFLQYRQTFTTQARKDMGEMFLFLDPAQVWAGSLCACAVLALGAWLVTGSFVFAAVIAAVAFLAPPSVLARARRRRLHRLELQLPDLLLELAGALRAGSGIQQAIRHSADHAPAPLSQELRLILHEQRMGVSFDQVLRNFHLRVPVESVSLIVSALNIAAQSGGSLAETLERISATLRTRLHLLGRIRALTSQGRMQMWVMASMPPVLVLVLHWLDPDAMAALWQTTAGWAVLIAVAVLELIGVFLIHRIVRIQV